LRAAVALATAPKARFCASAVPWALAALITCATATYVARTEGDAKNILFTIAVIGALGALGILIARRVLLASFSVAALVALLGAIAHLKQQTTDVTLHAYDAVSLLTSWTALDQLWHNQHRYVIAIVAALLAKVVLGWAVYKLDGSRVRRRHAFGAAVLFASLAWIGADAREARRHMGFYYEDRHLWFLLSSCRKTPKPSRPAP